MEYAAVSWCAELFVAACFLLKRTFLCDLPCHFICMMLPILFPTLLAKGLEDVDGGACVMRQQREGEDRESMCWRSEVSACSNASC